MAKKAAVEAVADVAVVAPEGPCILVEGAEGAEPYRVDVPVVFERTRVVTVAGQVYEHCADAADGRWIYRLSAF